MVTDFDGPLRIERARRLHELRTGLGAPVAPDLGAPGQVDFGHGSLFFQIDAFFILTI